MGTRWGSTNKDPALQKALHGYTKDMVYKYIYIHTHVHAHATSFQHKNNTLDTLFLTPQYIPHYRPWESKGHYETGRRFRTAPSPGDGEDT